MLYRHQIDLCQVNSLLLLLIRIAQWLLSPRHPCARSFIPTANLVPRPLCERLPHGRCGFLCYDPQISWTYHPSKSVTVVAFSVDFHTACCHCKHAFRSPCVPVWDSYSLVPMVIPKLQASSHLLCGFRELQPHPQAVCSCSVYLHFTVTSTVLPKLYPARPNSRPNSRPTFASLMGYRRRLVDTCKSSSVYSCSFHVFIVFLLCFLVSTDYVMMLHIMTHDDS